MLQIKKVTIDYSLTSENFCAIVSVDIGLTATIQLFEDAAMTKPRTTFMVGQSAYFKIVVSSDLNRDTETILFSKINIKTVTVRGSASSVPTCICENGAAPKYTSGEFNPNVQLELHGGSDREATFSFVFSQELTRRVLKPNSKKSFTIGVELDAYYINNAKKRFAFEILAEDNESKTFSTDVNVEGTTFEPTTAPEITGKSNGKTEPQIDNGLVIVTSILLMIVVLLF